MSRRMFLGGAAASGALLSAGLAGRTAAGAARGTGTKNLLYVPPVIDVAGLASPYVLTEAPGTVDLGGQLSKAWVYNGTMPGPTFRAKKGDTVRFTLKNGLAEPTITHWHGMLVTHENDGHPIQAIGSGGSYSYSYPIVQRAALNWYHPHPDMLTGEQVAMGLAGGFILNDAEEAALGLPSGAYEVPLVLRDAAFDSAGNLKYTPKGGGFLGSTPLVNGTRDPYLPVDSAVYRFRILGGANARVWGLGLSTGAPFWVIGNDGGLLPATAAVTRIALAPGERLDVLVDFRKLSTGTSVVLHDYDAGWDLLEFRVARQVTDTRTIPTALSTITPLVSPVLTRTFSFDGMSKINGKVYDINRIDFTVPFGQVERWRFITNGNGPHPVHVHGASFQVAQRTGGRGQIFPWEAGWKDTVLVQDFETVDVLIKFEAYKGEYVIHCHKLEHEDSGMMSNFVVA